LEILKVYLIILIAGGLLFVFGMVLLGYFTNLIADKYPDLIYLFDEVQLAANNQFSTQFELDEGEKRTITVAVFPRTNPIFFSINNPDGSVNTETIFNDLLSFPFKTNSSGYYTINVGNMGADTVLVSSFISDNPIVNTDLVLSTASNFIISSLIIMVGILLLIVGFGIFIFQKKRSKSKSN
jgi:hypothetical protein